MNTEEVSNKLESNSIATIFLFVFCNFLSPLSFVYIVYFVALKIYVIKFYIFSQTTITYESTSTKASNSDFAIKTPNECPVPALEGTNN